MNQISLIISILFFILTTINSLKQISKSYLKIGCLEANDTDSYVNGVFDHFYDQIDWNSGEWTAYSCYSLLNVADLCDCSNCFFSFKSQCENMANIYLMYENNWVVFFYEGTNITSVDDWDVFITGQRLKAYWKNGFPSDKLLDHGHIALDTFEAAVTFIFNSDSKLANDSATDNPKTSREGPETDVFDVSNKPSTANPTTNPTSFPTAISTTNLIPAPTIGTTPSETNTSTQNSTHFTFFKPTIDHIDFVNETSAPSTLKPSVLPTTSAVDEKESFYHYLYQFNEYIIIIAVVSGCCIIFSIFICIYCCKQKIKDKKMQNVLKKKTLHKIDIGNITIMHYADSLSTIKCVVEPSENVSYESDSNGNDNSINDLEQKYSPQSEEFKNNIEPLYHEKQRYELCLLHALNSLLQREEFTHKSLDNICNMLAPNKMINPHKAILGTGNYDANVLMMALSNINIDVQWYDARKANELDLNDHTFLEPDMSMEFVGFILNNPQKAIFGMFRRRHWLAIKRIDGEFYNLDSKLPAPKKYDSIKQLTDFLKEVLTINSAELMICRRKKTKEPQQLHIDCKPHNLSSIDHADKSVDTVIEI